MNKLYYLALLALFLLIVTHVSGKVLPDSLLTKDYIYEYTFSDTVKARQIIELMRQRKLEAEFVLDIVQGDLLFNNGKYNQALVYYERALASDSVRRDDKEYMEQLHRMISCYDCLHREKKKAAYVKLLLDKAEASGNKAMKSIALFNMGKMIYYQENKLRGYQMIKEAIDLMKQTNYKYKYDNLRYNYNTLLIMQQRDACYEEALQTLDCLETVVMESTHAEPAIEDLNWKEMKTLYAQRAVILSQLGRMQEADQVYKQWEAIGSTYAKDDYLIVPYLMNRHLFNRVIDIYIPREAFLKQEKDTVNYHMMTVKRTLAKAFRGKKDYKNAARYFEELAVLTDSLKAREQRSAAIELATAYETHKKEAYLQQQTARLKVRSILLLSAVGVLLLLFVLFIRNMQYTRTVRKKNHIMAGTIEELLTYKKEFFAKQEVGKPDQKVDTGKENADNGTEVSEWEENQRLFNELNSAMVREQLYLNPDLSREELMKLIHVNKNRIGQILQQCVGCNVTTYINNKRLDYAAWMLKTYDEYTVAFIAQSCGIPNVPTFNRQFRVKFGMTPTEFRIEIQQIDSEKDKRLL